MTCYIYNTNFKDQKIFDKWKRPFKLVNEIEEIIINKWNKKVKDENIAYVLSDIGKNDDYSSIINIFKNLKGHKHLIIGDHDNET